MSHVNVQLDQKSGKLLLHGSVHHIPFSFVGGCQLVNLTPLNATLPPILTPPIEIISRIIQLGAEDDKTTFPVSVSHICGKLRDIVLTTPMLWKPITFRGLKDVAQVQDRLARSQNVPIDVSVSNITSREEADYVIKLLVPHAKRWRSFHLDIVESKWTNMILGALEEVDTAPLLESMYLSNGASISGTPFNSFRGNAPALRTMSLKNVPVRWQSSMLNNVENLHIASHVWRPDAHFERWQNLRTLTIRSDPLQPNVFHFAREYTILPDLESLELNGVTEEDIVRLLGHVEMPSLRRLLFTHIKDSPNQVPIPIHPLPSVRELRLHATEMCQDNLLSVLRKVRLLDSISFEDSSPIPAFIQELTPNPADPETWVMPNITKFKVIAFEKDNAHRMYDDTDIALALGRMIKQRRQVKEIAVRMCVFEGERDDVTRHAADWENERPFKSERMIDINA